MLVVAVRRTTAAALRCGSRRVVMVQQMSSAAPGQPAEKPPREKDEVVMARNAAQKKARQGSVLPPLVRAEPDIPPEYPEDVSELGLLAQQPEEQRMRTVKIWQKAKTAMSSGTAKIHRWHITWGPPKTSLNGLMGWTGGDDPMAAMDMEFDTQEAAIRFAKKMGWKYDLKPEMKDTNASRFGTNNYSHNFLPKSVEHELKQNGTRTKLFENPKAGQSNYFRPLTWQGDRPVDQHGPASPTK